MLKISETIKIICEKPDFSTEEGRKRARARGITLTALTAMINKLLAMVVPLLTVRITLSYMGDEIYGLWSAVTSFFVLFTFADLGLGSGLQTELSKASVLDDRSYCRRLVSSCYIILASVAAWLVIIFLFVYPFVNWAKVLNAESEQSVLIVGSVVLAIVIPKLVNIPLALIQRTQFAMQEGYHSNLWLCFGNLLSLSSVFVIYRFDLGVLTIIWVSSLIGVVTAAINMLVYFGWQRPEFRPKIKCFDKTLAKKLLSTGVLFLILSIFTTLSLSVDNFIVAKVQTLSDVTPFSVMHKIVILIGAVVQMFSSPLWSANGEAMQRGEYGWVKKTTKKMSLISLGFAGMCTVGIMLFIKPALLLLTNGLVTANYLLLTGMCLQQIFVSVTSPYFMVLNGAGIVKFQIVNYAIYAAVSLPIKYLLGVQYGTVAIAWVGAISYVLLLTIPTILRAQNHLRTGVLK